MTEKSRKTLSVKSRKTLSVRHPRQGLLEESEDSSLTLLTLDLALPCRRFRVEHKVAEPGKVSVTAEFLLRFVKTMGGCSEEAAQSFFGYSRREMAFVLFEVETADYVSRQDGRISLTSTGHSLFKSRSEGPLIYDVERKTTWVGFDLISFAPAERRHASYFERRLPELPISDQSQVSSATQRVPSSFRKFFRELTSREEIRNTKRSLYSVDSVSAEDRFTSLVRVSLISSGLKPSIAEIDLSNWKSEYELSDREDVGRAVAKLVDQLNISRSADEKDAFDILCQLAPEYLKEWCRKDGLNVDRYYRHAFTGQGSVRSDRPTVPILGSLFTQDNARRLFEVANYGLRRVTRPVGSLYWAVPNIPLWGSTSILAEMLDQLSASVVRNNGNHPDNSRVKAVALTVGRPSLWVREAFDCHFQSESLIFPNGMEILLVPGAFVAATVHAPIGVISGLPVPLGFASFDAQIIERATYLLRNASGKFQLGADLESGLRAVSSYREPNDGVTGDPTFQPD